MHIPVIVGSIMLQIAQSTANALGTRAKNDMIEKQITSNNSNFFKEAKLRTDIYNLSVQRINLEKKAMINKLNYDFAKYGFSQSSPKAEEERNIVNNNFNTMLNTLENEYHIKMDVSKERSDMVNTTLDKERFLNNINLWGSALGGAQEVTRKYLKIKDYSQDIKNSKEESDDNNVE